MASFREVRRPRGIDDILENRPQRIEAVESSGVRLHRQECMEHPARLAWLSGHSRKYGDVCRPGAYRPGAYLASVASCPAGVGVLMPRSSPYRIDLSDEERVALDSMARSYTSPYWQVTRARMVLLAAEGLRNDEIAARLDCGRDVVSQWRKRFFEQRLAGLEDRPRRGRPPVFPP